MTAPALIAAPAQTPDPQQDPAPAPQSARTIFLLTVVRALITFGKELSAALQHSAGAAKVPFDVAVRFGTCNIALLIARVTRGLELAAALEAKLTLRAHRSDPVRTAPTRRSLAARKPTGPRANVPGFDSADDVIPAIPTAEEIAAALRRLPLHAVLTQICSDLGLLPSDPLYQEVERAIMDANRAPIALGKDVRKRVALGIRNFIAPDLRFVWPKLPPLSDLLRPPATAAATGPP